MPAVAGDHAGQDGMGDVHQPLRVCVHHGVPIVERSALRRLQAKRKARVAHKHFDAGEGRRQREDSRLHGCPVPHVERDGMEPFAPDLVGQRVQGFWAAGSAGGVSPPAAHRTVRKVE